MLHLLAGLTRRNPNGTGNAIMEQKIRAKLEELRGMLQADGGDLEVVAINDVNVSLKLKGAFGSCPHATMTIKQGIERVLREEINPRITVTQAH